MTSKKAYLERQAAIGTHLVLNVAGRHHARHFIQDSLVAELSRQCNGELQKWTVTFTSGASEHSYSGHSKQSERSMVLWT
jgi:hypothetical protein